MADEPLIDSLRDAASDCRHFSLIGEPPIDTLIDWADLLDRAATALEPMPAEPLLDSLRRRLRIMRWKLRARRCGCGEHRLAPDTTMQMRGVLHRIGRPCYRCDTYGNPL